MVSISTRDLRKPESAPVMSLGMGSVQTSGPTRALPPGRPPTQDGCVLCCCLLLCFAAAVHAAQSVFLAPLVKRDAAGGRLSSDHYLVK